MQNESLLRFYDKMQSNQLNFGKGDKRISVFTKPSETRPHASRIVLQYMEKGSPEALLRAGSKKRFRPIMNFSEQMGDDVLNTSFIQDRKSPGALHRALVSRFRRQGWEPIRVPKPIGRDKPANYSQMARGNDALYLQVTPNEEEGGSIATVTTVTSARR